MQNRRYEYKYLIEEAVAVSVREFVRSYLSLDEYGVSMPEGAYPVNSLYLDSQDLQLFQSTINGDRNRMKLRLRFYEQDSRAPVYLEIKRRTDSVIVKSRGVVDQDSVEEVLAGQVPMGCGEFGEDACDGQSLNEFCRLVSCLNAQPVARVTYLREAWVSDSGNSVRVTMDRKVNCAPAELSDPLAELSDAVCVFGNSVVLELKFTNRFPDWFRELVRRFNLIQCGAAKYVDGATLLGTDRLSAEAACRTGVAPPASSLPHLSRREQFLTAYV